MPKIINGKEAAKSDYNKENGVVNKMRKRSRAVYDQDKQYYQNN
jgi:hypothetical protein